MKKIYAFAILTVLLTAVGCRPEPRGPFTAYKEPEKLDPELELTGVPTKQVESGASFTFKIETKSDGEVTMTIDKPNFAYATKVSDMEYKVVTLSEDDVKVKISVNQAKTDEYKSAKTSKTFKIKGSGPIPVPGEDDEVEGTKVDGFVEAEGEVTNPERGMYCAYEIYNSSFNLSAAEVRSKVQTGHTVQLLEFYLTEYMSSEIDAKYLNMIQRSFDAIRNGGAKAIVRFAYMDHAIVDDNDKPAGAMDATEELVLKHVAQLKPVLVKNEDVLFVLQAGFVGAWGEWYYTTNFGFKPTKDEDFLPRKHLTDALLDAVPASRQIQLRTPKFKMRMYNWALADTISAKTAHDGSAKSRLAGHNDCFVASANDQGTFDSETTREYWKAETRYTIMGGETCDPLTPENYIYCECDNTLKNLEDYHWTYLHDGYFAGILSRWQTQGCMDEIKARLGYRLVVKDVHYEAIEAGMPCKVTIRMHNKGFAAPMNPRSAFLIWETPSGDLERFMISADPRNWQPGYCGVVGFFSPSTVKGTLYLELADPLLPDVPEYSIALANKNIFDPETGLNKLFEVK